MLMQNKTNTIQGLRAVLNYSDIKYQSILACFTCVSMLRPCAHKYFHHLIYNSFNILIFSLYLLG